MAVTIKPLQPLDAIAAFEARHGNLLETFSWQDAWQEEHATMFTVAKSAGFDILKDIQTAFERALRDGQTPQDFARQLRPVLQEKGWWGRKLVADPASGELVPAQLGSARRLQTIFDANMRVSYAAGHWTNFERNRRTRPYLRYVALLDDRTRPSHRARHNLVLPVDHPYWDMWAPPCGWNCRCTLQSLSQRDIDRLQGEGEKLVFEPPTDTFRNFVNKRTGEITRVPDGIDPGWAYNPGRAGYEARVNQALAEKIADAPPAMVQAAVEERVSSSAFDRFFRNPQGSMPVLAVPAEISAAIGTDMRVAILTADRMRQQQMRRPELTLEDYRAIPSIAANPALVVQDGLRTFFLAKHPDGRWRYVTVMVRDDNRSAGAVTSFRYAGDRDVDNLLARDGARIVIDRRQK
ncbi:phage head morphogenesis protein [Pseudorhizobium halotolerans]|uniref:Phage head morphogenesis protein n=1 Tax=Pseudorhizobium halotolerans TaxID=1233081 RepID=A0ABN7K0X5_9HYPH|nr:phage minor head protein [Pseudorhizobium halotolerans]CAD7055411.1 phage head morphogenesis protein [Pseudorhizobium halotolerans]